MKWNFSKIIEEQGPRFTSLVVNLLEVDFGYLLIQDVQLTINSLEKK